MLFRKFLILKSNPFLTIHGPEDPPEKKEEDQKKEDQKKEGQGGDDDDKPVLSNKKVNALLAEEKRKMQKIIDENVANLQRLQKSQSLTEKEKNELQTRIEELQNSLLSKEELAAKDKERLAKEHKEERDKLAIERDEWRTRYTRETINRSILDGAVQAEAFNPSQVVNLLQTNARLVEVLDDDGKPTGRFETKIKFDDLDKTGKAVTLDLTPSEVMKRMIELPDQYGNLFKSGIKGGLGSNNGDSSRDKNVKDMTTEEYRIWRKKKGLNRND